MTTPISTGKHTDFDETDTADDGEVFQIITQQ